MAQECTAVVLLAAFHLAPEGPSTTGMASTTTTAQGDGLAAHAQQCSRLTVNEKLAVVRAAGLMGEDVVQMETLCPVLTAPQFLQQCAQQCRGQGRGWPLPGPGSDCESCLAKAVTDAVPGQGRDDLNKVFQANHQQMRYHQKKKNRMVGQQNRRATKALKLQADRETLENLLKPWRTHEPEPCVNLVPSLSKFQVLQVLLKKVDKEIEKNTLKEFAAARQIATHTRHLVELWGCSRL